MRSILKGNNCLVYFRRRADRATEDASRLVFQTEVSVSKDKETEETPTVEGNNLTIGGGAIELDMSSLAYKDDTETRSAWREIEGYFDAEDLVEIWIVNLDYMDEEGNTTDIRYYNGYLTSFEMSASADGNVEISLAYSASNEAFGEEVLDPDQMNTLDDFRYMTLEATGPEA